MTWLHSIVKLPLNLFCNVKGAFMTSLEKLLLNLETEINKDTTLDRQMRELHLQILDKIKVKPLPHETSALHSDISAYLRQSAPARLRGGQKTLYYFGRIRGNTCDNAAAMRYYIQAEKHITQNENLSISGRLLKFCNQTNNP